MRPAESFAKAWTLSVAILTLWGWAVTVWFPFTQIYGKSPTGSSWIRIASVALAVTSVAAVTWFASGGRTARRLAAALVAVGGWWLLGPTGIPASLYSEVNRVMTSQTTLAVAVGFAIVAASLGLCALGLFRAEQRLWAWFSLCSFVLWASTYLCSVFGAPLGWAIMDASGVLWVVLACEALLWSVLATVSASSVEWGWRRLSNQRIEQTASR